MAKCFISSQTDVEVLNPKTKRPELLKNEDGEQVVRYELVFEADDGYREEHVYQCSEKELKDAVSHFNDAHIKHLHDSLNANLAKEPVPANEPIELSVASSKDAKAMLSELQSVPSDASAKDEARGGQIVRRKLIRERKKKSN